MRADRLLSLLMLLQTRGVMTANELASELEVSERTIYRDMTALSAAGVPVYALHGPHGGLALVEDYRTNLTGLTSDEVRALFMLSIPAPLDQLGVGAELRAALLKLSAALPSSRRADEERARQRFHLDSGWWFQAEEATPHLNTLQQAVWSDHLVRMVYRSQFDAEIEQVAAPYGLVAKANIWYLVGRRGESVRAWRVGRIKQAEMLEESFERPPDFNLADFWKGWCEQFIASRSSYNVTARLAPELARQLLREDNRPSIEVLQPADEQGWVSVQLSFESLETARTQILGYGGAIEVIQPQALRLSVIDFAAQIRAAYPPDVRL